MIRRVFGIGIVGFLLLVVAGCVAPRTFVKTLEPTWASIELRKDITYVKAWEIVVDSLVKRFDLEILSKENGYLRTNWLYSWTGRLNERYRVRVTVKFSPDHRKIELKSEAEYGGAGMWIMGYDTRLLETIKSDITGNIGRTTR